MTDFDSSLIRQESLWLAPYAMHSVDTAGREHKEPPHAYRAPYQRDRDRIVHSSAYRRLAHKTQVFTGAKGDYHRTRLTHTLEVSSVARTIGRVLRLNEDLIESLALMHDIGHPPFGHAGEEILDACCASCGGFNHNRQAVRIVTVLEDRYPEFPGLNLSKEILLGQGARISGEKNPTSRQSLLEVQVVDAADSIAYDTHDADDALELGLLDIEELLELPLWSDAARRVQKEYSALDSQQLRRAVVRQVIDILVTDLVDMTTRGLKEAGIDSPAAVVGHDKRLVAPSPEVFEQKNQLEEFLFQHVYRHPAVLAERSLAGDALREMFDRFSQHPECLPARFREQLQHTGVARVVCDFLSGMTDRSALEEAGLRYQGSGKDGHSVA